MKYFTKHVFISAEKIEPPLLSKPIKDEIPNEVMVYLMQAGQQAPSGENTQPWFLSYKKNIISLQLDPTADPSLLNVNQIASAIACGAVAENIRIASTQYGLHAEIEVKQAQGITLSIAIIIKHINMTESPLAKLIWERQTNRTKFNQNPIPQVNLNKLGKICDDTNTVSLDLFTDRSDINRIAKMVYKADLLRMQVQNIHESLMSNIRFTNEEAVNTRNGFHLKNLEVGSDGELFLKFIKPWKIANFMNKIGASHIAASLASKGVKQASAMGLIRIKGQGIQDFFEGGRALERIWLETTRLGLSFQPMTVLTFLWMNQKLEGTESFSAQHKKLLASIWQDYQQIFHCDEDESHIMLFRIGYGKPMKTGTLRKEITST